MFEHSARMRPNFLLTQAKNKDMPFGLPSYIHIPHQRSQQSSLLFTAVFFQNSRVALVLATINPRPHTVQNMFSPNTVIK